MLFHEMKIFVIGEECQLVVNDLLQVRNDDK